MSLFVRKNSIATALPCLLAWLLAVEVPVSATDYSDDPVDVRKGAELFKIYCAACHDFAHDTIGPALGRVTATQDKQWILDFVRNPQGMIDKRDPRSLELLERYNNVMPTFGLSDEDLELILAYVDRRQVDPTEIETAVGNRKGLSDPIPQKIRKAGIGLDLKLAWKIPASDETPPQARINKMTGFVANGEERLFVNDQRGLLYELTESGPQVFLDLAKERENFISAPGLATGFTSFAFSPSFESNGSFYTQHAERRGSGVADFSLPEEESASLQYVILEWSVDLTSGEVDRASARELMRFDMKGRSHGVQELAFNPYANEGDEDFGLLYVGIGDGGASYSRRPDLFEGESKIWSKILRIDPLGNNSRNGKYGIPPGNPFASGEQAPAGALPEIYATGFRNPNTLAWSKEGEFYASEIGHWNVEEINRVEVGGDYGWPRVEGLFEINLLDSQHDIFPLSQAHTDVVSPLIQIDHDEIRAIAGGFFYYGENLELLNGLYLFGGIATGRVFCVDLSLEDEAEVLELQLFEDGAETTISALVNAGRADLRIGKDARGRPYILSKSNGSIWRVAQARKL